MLAIRRTELPLIVRAALDALLVQRGERADGALLPIEPLERFASVGRVHEDLLHQVGPVGLATRDTRRRDRPIPAVSAPELVLARELRAVDAPLDVLQPLDRGGDSVRLEKAALDARVIVRGAVVR